MGTPLFIGRTMNFKDFLEARQPPSLDWEIDDYLKGKEEEDYEQNWIYDRPRQFPRDPYVAYDNYVAAMDRRRPGTALDYERFINHIYRDDVKSFRFGDSYVFGGYKNGIFFPSHFSPASMREGAKLFSELAKHRVVLFVPDDLADMAERVGFEVIARGIPADFRGETVLKNVLVSNHKLVPELRKMMSDMGIDNFTNFQNSQ